MADIDINKLLQSDAVNANADPAALDRAIEIAGWSESAARTMARAEGIDLSEAHIKAIKLLQDRYVAHGPAPHARFLAAELNDAFAAEGGSRYLYRLFPGGPVAQGSRLAGVPAPHDTKDPSFGSTY